MAQAGLRPRKGHHLITETKHGDNLGHAHTSLKGLTCMFLDPDRESRLCKENLCKNG